MRTDVYEMIAVAPLRLVFLFFERGRGLVRGVISDQVVKVAGGEKKNPAVTCDR